MEEQQKTHPADAKRRSAGTKTVTRQNANPKKKRPAPAHGDAPSTAAGKKRRPPAAQGDANRPVNRKKRRPAAAQGDVQRSAPRWKPRPDAARSEAQRTTAGRKPRPTAARSNVQRAAAGQKQRPASATLLRSGAARIRNTASDAVRGLEVRRFSVLMFAVVAVIYIIILALVIHSATKKAHTYLGEYESSRPQYRIEEYVAALDDSFFSEMIEQSVGDMSVSEYETVDMLWDSVEHKAEAPASYSYQKTADFTDSRPSYYILRNNEAVATVTLHRSGWTEKYSFPVWGVDDPVSILDLHAKPAYTVSVTVPQDATVRINGVEVPQGSFTDALSELQLTATELVYMNQPVSRSCEITGLFCAPTVEAVDADGNVLEPETVPDLTRARQEYVFAHADTPDPDPALLQYVDGLTHAYMNYVMNTQCAIDANLAVLNQYLLPGSTLAVLMQKIYTDVWYNNDPTLREDHVYEVRHVRMYADNLCTVDVHLESTFGRVAVNDYAGTVRWVLVNNGFGWRASNIELRSE